MTPLFLQGGENMKDALLNRLRNPYFILAVVSFLYQVLVHFGIHVPTDLYTQLVDLLSFVLMGTGIMKSYNATPTETPKPIENVQSSEPSIIQPIQTESVGRFVNGLTDGGDMSGLE
jgi:uncharacterized membrane protein